MRTLKAQFSKIKAENKVLKTLQDQDFYDRKDVLKTMLSDFLYEFRSSQAESFVDLSKADFLLLCELVSSLRPMEPHAFLTRVSMALDTKRGL